MKLSLGKLRRLVQRTAIALFLVISLAAMATWWLMPDINRMRPQIEALLKQEFQLSQLKLQGLSWYWAGYIGFKVAHCDLKTNNQMVKIEDAALLIELSPIALLYGTLSPKRIALHGGLLQLDVSHYNSKSHLDISPTHLTLDDMKIQWRYASYQGKLDSAALDINIPAGTALLRMPGVRLTATLNAQSQLASADWSFDNTHWLPAEWQKFIVGNVSGEAHLRQKKPLQWQLDMQTQGISAAINLPSGPFQLPFDQLLSTWLITFDKQQHLQAWDIPSLQWSQGKNRGKGNAHWQDGKFSLQASSGHLDMPLLWSWLRPLDDSIQWRNWLSTMHSGIASGIEVSLDLPWQQPLQGLPDNHDWDAMHYHVGAQIHDADIHLGFADNRLTNSSAKVDLDEHGLQADISHVSLPHEAGSASGTLRMPWNTLIMSIQAHGQSQLENIQHWLKASNSELIHWLHAPAATNIELQWSPLESKPRLARIALEPTGVWLAEANHTPLEINAGQLLWDMQHGLTAKNMNIQGKLFHGSLSFQAIETELQTWQLKSLTSHMQGNFADIVAYFHMPIEQASGQLHTDIRFHDGWHGSLNLEHAAWKNFLGSKKTEASPMQISFEGTQNHGTLTLDKLICKQAPIQLLGSGQISQQGLKLNLASLKAPAFQGALKVSAPFSKEPWEMLVDAQYVNRKALPEQLPQTELLADKPWALQAKIERFIWDDASMQGVSIKLASKQNSAGSFKARTIHSSTLILQNVSALFSLPGNSAVDLRQLSASMGKQHLLLSASLTPETKGGVHWKGFAQLSGDFGETMHQAKLTKLFSGGDMQALFLGEGVLLRKQAWWEGLRGRLRLHVDKGLILKGGTLTKTLAAVSLVDLPDLFFGDRKDLKQDGLFYKRLQIEASLKEQMFDIHKLALRSSAMDIAGEGSLDLEKNTIDLKMIVRPFQNLDALLGKIPLLRDILGGAAHSLIRKIYHMHGDIANAEVDQLSPQEAGLSSPGLIESLLNIPNAWFGKGPVFQELEP